MTRGPKPLPKAEKVARGTDKNCRDAGKIEAPVGIPDPPEWLTDPRARAEFIRIGQLQLDLGFIAEIDGNHLGRYCETLIRWVEASELVRKKGIVCALKKGGTQRLNPAHFAEIKYAGMLGRMEAEMGMTPSARSRIRIDEGKVAQSREEAEIAEIFGEESA